MNQKHRLLPPVIGHRGAALLAPENTLAGFRKAAALGCAWVEFDVRLTADERLAVIHDSDVDRTALGTGRVRDMTLDAVTALDAGARFDDAFEGETIPSLTQAIAELARLGLRANIEIKCDPGDADAAAAVLVNQLRQEWPQNDPPLISSFDHLALEGVRRRSADLPIGVLVPTMAHDWQIPFRALNAATLHVGTRRLEADQVAGPVAEGIEIGVYTVNDAARAAELFSWGIAGVFSDRPDAIAAAVADLIAAVP